MRPLAKNTVPKLSRRNGAVKRDKFQKNTKKTTQNNDQNIAKNVATNRKQIRKKVAQNGVLIRLNIMGLRQYCYGHCTKRRPQALKKWRKKYNKIAKKIHKNGPN